MKTAEKQLELVPIAVGREEELRWLQEFIVANYQVPKFMIPTQDDLKAYFRKFFRAVVVTPGAWASKTIGVTGYEIRTPYLAETIKTIISKEFRGGGWGKTLSWAIEEEVRKAGFHKIRTSIYHNNFPMIQIKLAQGYIIEGFHRDHDGPGLHEYSLGKILN